MTCAFFQYGVPFLSGYDFRELNARGIWHIYTHLQVGDDGSDLDRELEYPNSSPIIFQIKNSIRIRSVGLDGTSEFDLSWIGSESDLIRFESISFLYNNCVLSFSSKFILSTYRYLIGKKILIYMDQNKRISNMYNIKHLFVLTLDL